MKCSISLICISAFGRYRELDRVTDKADVRRLRKHTSRFVPVFTISRDPAPAAVEPN
jgi:hypothetical protein